MEISDYWLGVIVASALSFVFFGFVCGIVIKKTSKELLAFMNFSSTAYKTLSDGTDEALDALRNNSPEEARMCLIQAKKLVNSLTSEEFSTKLRNGEF